MGSAKRKVSACEGWLGITLRVLHVTCGVCAVICSIIVLGACEFINYEPTEPPEGVDDNRTPDTLNITFATVGLYRYNRNNEGCREISEDFDVVSGQFTAARVGAYMGAIAGIVGLVLIIFEVTCCRYPCSRLLISCAFFVAFVGQALTFFIYLAPVCDPNFKNGPFPCSPATSTWVSTAACILFFLSCCLACCLPKPVPVFIRMRENARDKDEEDGWCAVCAKTAIDEEEEGEEEDEENTAEEEEEEEEVQAKGGGVVVVTDKGIEEGQEVVDEQEAVVDERQAAVARAATLAAVRRAKLAEIEKQLALLEKYKDQYSEEEYTERVGVLLAALPDPNTFDAYTKTEIPAPPQPDTVEDLYPDEEQGLVGEQGLTDEQGEEVKDRNMFQKMSDGMGAGIQKTKDATKRKKKKKHKKKESKGQSEDETPSVMEESSLEVEA